MIRAALFTALLTVVAAQAAWPPIAPTTVTLRFPAATSAVIAAADGRPAYRLQLSVDPTVDDVASNLSLLLLPLNAPPDADNLLEPPGRWHGYQPFFFAADDFKNGPVKSFFGPVREFCRDRTGLNTVIAVKRAAVAPSRVPGTLAFRELILDISLKSAPALNGKLICR